MTSKRRRSSTHTVRLRLAAILAFHDPMGLIFDDACNLDEYVPEAEWVLSRMQLRGMTWLRAISEAFAVQFGATTGAATWDNNKNIIAAAQLAESTFGRISPPAVASKLQTRRTVAKA